METALRPTAMAHREPAAGRTSKHARKNLGLLGNPSPDSDFLNRSTPGGNPTRPKRPTPRWDAATKRGDEHGHRSRTGHASGGVGHVWLRAARFPGRAVHPVRHRARGGAGENAPAAHCRPGMAPSSALDLEFALPPREAVAVLRCTAVPDTGIAHRIQAGRQALARRGGDERQSKSEESVWITPSASLTVHVDNV
jgi:hypothetical protein